MQKYIKNLIYRNNSPSSIPPSVLPRHTSRQILSSCQCAAVVELVETTALSGVTIMSSLWDEHNIPSLHENTTVPLKWANRSLKLLK